MIRVTAPSSPVVPLEVLKQHLRVDHSDDDNVIEALELAAVAHLDGYRGVLGRAILEQEWSVTYGQAGTFRLPLPDVSAATADAGDLTLTHDCLGATVTLTEAATVTFTCALPAEALPAVIMAVKLLVGHWYENREAAGPSSTAALPLAFDALIAPLRWVRA